MRRRSEHDPVLLWWNYHGSGLFITETSRDLPRNIVECGYTAMAAMLGLETDHHRHANMAGKDFFGRILQMRDVTWAGPNAWHVGRANPRNTNKDAQEKAAPGRPSPPRIFLLECPKICNGFETVKYFHVLEFWNDGTNLKVRRASSCCVLLLMK